MKILFVGDRDSLAEGILERLGKEGHNVSLLTTSGPGVKGSRRELCKTYRYDHQSNLHSILESANPETIVFAGSGYMDYSWTVGQKDNLSLLGQLLEESRSRSVHGFVLLSSTDVYGSTPGDLSENTPIHPETLKGVWCAEYENMVKTYSESFGIPSVILRLGPVFGREMDLNGQEWLAQLSRTGNAGTHFVQPICSMDAADALVRVLGMSENTVYNVCASECVRSEDVLAALEGREAQGADRDQTPSQVVRNDRLKSEQEWLDMKQVVVLLREDKIRRKQAPTVGKKKKKQVQKHPVLRKTLENLALLAVFTLLYVLSSQHQLFAQVHWMLIYVMIVALCYGVRQGTLSVLLASAVYLSVERGDIFEMTNFYSYVGNVIVIVEFIFFGIVIGYVADDLRERIRISQRKNEDLQTSYQKLQEINEKNLYIKNEYEKRLLQTRNTIPNLYSIISKINVLDSERIFVELLQVVKELINTDTVAIYRFTPASTYLRLLTSLNPESVMEKRSWNVENYPEIQAAIRDHQVYQGDVWKNEPAIVMSIPYGETDAIVLVIKHVPMEQMSLYYVNVLRTLFMLVSQALERASQYDSLARSSKYVEDTNILVPQEFQKILELAQEKKRLDVADFILLKICGTEPLLEKYSRVAGGFRDLDQFGTDGSDQLYVLLSNASKADNGPVLNRLALAGILAESIQDVEFASEDTEEEQESAQEPAEEAVGENAEEISEESVSNPEVETAEEAARETEDQPSDPAPVSQEVEEGAPV